METAESGYMELCRSEMRDLMGYHGRKATLYSAPNGRNERCYFSVSSEGETELRPLPVEGTLRCAGACFDRLTVSLESGRKAERGFPSYILADMRDKIRELREREKASGRAIHPRVVFRDSFLNQPDITEIRYVKPGDILHIHTGEGTRRLEVC